MKRDRILNLIKSKTGVALGASLTIVSVLTAVLAHAQVTPTVTTQIHNASHVAITTANIGSIVHDDVNVASTTGPTPEGTVDFNLYSNTTCSGGVTSVQGGVSLATGTAESATTTVGSAGISYKVHYNGQGDVYAPVDGPCEPLFATSNSVTITGALSSSTVLVGTSVSLTGTLHNITANATGTVAYNYYTDNGCSINQTSAGSLVVTNGNVASSNSILFNSAGTFYWKANYSGDQFNTSAASSCLPLTVLSTSTTPTPIPVPLPTGTGSISGTVYNDVNRSFKLDSGDIGLGGWTVNLYKGFQGRNNLPVKTVITDANGLYSFSALPMGFYTISEVKQAGWRETKATIKFAFVGTGATLTDYNFGNISTIASSTATTTEKHDNGNHFGFFKKLENQMKKVEKFINHQDKKALKGKKGDGDQDNDD